MEQIIRLLPEHICNQIAAGEVIQRPASVVKELVENAIDAGATAIDVFIKDAGKTLIQVMDNGKGMSLVDTKMAFERHATSKITCVDDLFALQTKGFRGEALASIASIAHVTLKTKREADEVGTSVINEGGKIVQQEPVVCKNGTSFEIKNLFFNVPARRNFLKSDAVEFGHIEDEFLRVALVHDTIAFNLYHNGTPIYQLSSSNQRKRIVDIFGRAMNDKLAPVEEDTDIVKIRGFIVKPEFAKKTRKDQYFFVNDRFFKDAYLNNAISSAFEGLVAPGTHPAYFIHFDVDPARIDVNVHPTKTEIKFEYHKEMYAYLRTAVREALGKFNIAPSLDFEKETAFDIPYDMKFQPAIEPQIKVNPNYNPFHSSSNVSRTKAESDYTNKSLQSFGFGKNEVTSDDWANFYQITEEETIPSQMNFEGEAATTKEMMDFSSLLLIKNIALVSVKEQLYAVHVGKANERLLFDELLQTFIVQQVPAQRLLFSVEIASSHQEQLHWNENTKIISRLGFEWQFQQDVLEILSVPAMVEADYIPFVIQGFREKLMDEHVDKSDLAHVLIGSIASGSSRFKKWTTASAQMLLEKWSQLDDKLQAPDGSKIIKIWNPLDLIK